MGDDLFNSYPIAYVSSSFHWRGESYKYFTQKCRNRFPFLLELSKGSVNMTEKLMRAVQYDHYGGGASALKHVKVPLPSPKKDEVLVKIEACSINPVDWKYQRGDGRPIFPRKFPHIPGYDIAGEVADVGPGVVSFKPGDKVVGYLEIGSAGGLAEYVAAKVSLIIPRPPEVSVVEASSLPIAALTAHQALTKVAGINLDGSGPQKNILVTAASGGVGHFAIQLPKLGNTHVTATCGARNIDFVKSLGADEVIDYKTPEGAALNSPSGRKYDVVVHCAIDIPWSTFEPNLSPNGTVIDLTPGLASVMSYVVKKLTFSKKQLVPMVLSVKKENLSYVVDLVKEGKIKVRIDSTYPLSKVEEAWAKSMDGHATGKIIVEI